MGGSVGASARGAYLRQSTSHPAVHIQGPACSEDVCCPLERRGLWFCVSVASIWQQEAAISKWQESFPVSSQCLEDYPGIAATWGFIQRHLSLPHRSIQHFLLSGVHASAARGAPGR